MTLHYDDDPVATTNGASSDLSSRKGKRAAPGSSGTGRYPLVESGKIAGPTVALLGAVLIAGSVGDFVNAKTLFDLVFAQSVAAMAWCLAISITVLAVIATHFAGYAWREGIHRSGLRPLAALILTIWAAAGGLLALARIIVADSTSPSAAAGPFRQLGPSAAPHPLAVPLLLAAVWAITGLVSFGIGYLVHHPASAALAKLSPRDRAVTEALIRALKEERVAGHLLDGQRLHRTRMPDNYRSAAGLLAAHRDELAAHARLELVRVLGDPAATNDILPRPATDKE